MVSNEHTPERYELPGALVEVHQPFGEEHYYALVDLNGRYPEPGKIAHNIGRREYMQLLEGRVALTINNISHILKPPLSRLVNDGDRYYIEGSGKVLVFVEDREGGTTKTEDIQ